ncbi:YciI family protein [Tunturibacter psychrotolerans]|uniref:YciI family protein n=1 Tax=Tunturiibacter psychrotolerans TaxID=3069686 RepID=A0AAU7ZP05_9BACT
MKYICLGYYEPAKHASMTADERNAMFDECFVYDDYLRANGHFVGGEALQPEETALTVYWKKGKVATTDGPYAETKEQLGGILMLEARDMNHAIQLMSQHPSLKYGTLFEIHPTFDMSGMIQESEQRRGKVAAR